MQDTGFTVADTSRLAPAYANADEGIIHMPALQRFTGFEGASPVLIAPGRALQQDAFPSGGAGMTGCAQDTLKLLETLRTGGAYGHSWFTDPLKKLTVVAFTNTALEGMSGGGRFPAEIRNTIYKEHRKS
jgi:CubicO group peptidase (beta-lactamase class C family)